MNRIKDALKRRRQRRATLPWRELEAEAARQGVSPADIFFDHAGRPGPELQALRAASAASPPPRRSVHPPARQRSVVDSGSRRT